MFNLNVVIFGQQLDWTVSTTVLVLMLAQIVLVAVALIAFVILSVKKRGGPNKKQNILVTHAAVAKEKERALVGITLDTVVVKRKFTVGEPFTAEGLVVTANYSGDPKTELVSDYTVDEPNMDREGRPAVNVRYGEFTAYYTIEVDAEAVREPVAMILDTQGVKKQFRAGEPFECAGLVVRMRYTTEPLSEEVYTYTVDEPAMDEAGRKTVAVRYADFVEVYEIEVLPEEKERALVGIDLDVELVKADFTVGDEFDSTGLVVVARYDAAPYEERVEDFTVDTPDLTKKGMTNVTVRYQEFTQTYPIFVSEPRALVGISLDTSVVRKEFTLGEEFNHVGLIVTADYDAEPLTEEMTDFEVEAPDMQTEGEREVTVRCLGMTAAYTVKVVAPPVEETAPQETPAPIEEVAPAEDDSVLRLDRSFTARLIQGNDKTKVWYSMLKNELLSYQRVKDRMSWKRETYRFVKETVAKLGFRGSTLCIFLALDPAVYTEDGRYKVEDVSSNKSFEETPCMYRIKNDMRAKRALELIRATMDLYGAERFDRTPEDYVFPYEETDALIEQGLIRGNMVSSGAYEEIAKTED